MAGRLTRFLNLEKARKPSDTPAHGIATRARFSDEPPAPAAEESFRAEREAQLRSGIEVEAGSAAEQPFFRCPVCEGDNTKYAVKCINCQGRLDSDEVRSWNARLWKERRKERAQEPAVRPPPPPAVQQQLGELLARQVAQTERARMGWNGDSRDRTPLGMKLLELIPDPNLRFAAAMGMVAAFFGSGLVAFVAKGHPALQAVGTVVAVALLILFMPNRRRRSRWWEDD